MPEVRCCTHSDNQVGGSPDCGTPEMRGDAPPKLHEWLADTNHDRVLLIRVNHGTAGFFAQVLFVINQLIFAERHGLIPYVDFGECTVNGRDHFASGQANPYHDPAHGANWWESYFEPLSRVRASQLASPNARALPSQHMWMLHTVEPESVYTYPYGKYSNLRGAPYDNSTIAWYDCNRQRAAGVLSRWVRVLPHVEALVDAFWSRVPAGPVLGLHVRGTDKQASIGGDIVPPATYLPHIERYLGQHPAASIFLASDSPGFVAELRQRYGERLFVREVLRSQQNSFLDATQTDNYRKGEDVLLDALLLARCSFLIKSSSAVAEFAIYFSYPRLRDSIIDLQHGPAVEEEEEEEAESASAARAAAALQTMRAGRGESRAGFRAGLKLARMGKSCAQRPRPITILQYHADGSEVGDSLWRSACGADVFGAVLGLQTDIAFDCGVHISLVGAVPADPSRPHLKLPNTTTAELLERADAVLIGGGHGDMARAHAKRGGPILSHEPWPYTRFTPDPRSKRPGQKWIWCSKENGVTYPQLDMVGSLKLRRSYGIDVTMSYRAEPYNANWRRPNLSPHLHLPTTFLSSIYLGEFAQTLRPRIVPKWGERIRRIAVVQAQCQGADSLWGNEHFELRRRGISELVRSFPTDSMGVCEHNAEQRFPWPWGANGGRPAGFHWNKMDNIYGYAFVLAAESVRLSDWVTEKVYQALAVGSVPVYIGAPNMLDYLPCRHCAIDASHFKSTAALATYLRALLHNRTAYEEYLAWAHTPYDPSDFPRFEEHIRGKSFDTTMCRLCELLRPGQCQCSRWGCNIRQQELAVTFGKHA